MSSLLPESIQDRVVTLEAELNAVTKELAETNLGVLALYSELDDRAQQLAEAIELKGRFLSYMSHEFRTPLSSIISMTGLLDSGMDGSLSEEQHKQVNFIRTAATELTEIVNDLLDLAKIDAGRISVSPEWFQMVDLFGALRGMFKPLVINSSVNLTFESATAVPAVFTDHKKLMQILRNFISNALKFTESGVIRVSAKLDAPDYVIFSVADTGIGIPEEYLEAIFQDFVQVNSSIQRRYRGTGLGLALCKKMAELLGGSVGVTSKVGVGSTFFVRLPIEFSEVAGF